MRLIHDPIIYMRILRRKARINDCAIILLRAQNYMRMRNTQLVPCVAGRPVAIASASASAVLV